MTDYPIDPNYDPDTGLDLKLFEVRQDGEFVMLAPLVTLSTFFDLEEYAEGIITDLGPGESTTRPHRGGMFTITATFHTMMERFI